MFILLQIFILNLITLKASLETAYVNRSKRDVFNGFGTCDYMTNTYYAIDTCKCAEFKPTFYMDETLKTRTCYRAITGIAYIFRCQTGSCKSGDLTCKIKRVMGVEVWNYKNGQAYWNATNFAQYFTIQQTTFEVITNQGEWQGLLLRVKIDCDLQLTKTVLLKIEGIRKYPLEENILKLPTKKPPTPTLTPTTKTSTTEITTKTTTTSTTTKSSKTSKQATKSIPVTKIKTPGITTTPPNTTIYSAEKNVQSTSKTPIIIGTVLSVIILVILVTVAYLIRRRASNQNQTSKTTQVKQVEQPMYAQYVSTQSQPSALEENQQLDPRYETLVPENQSDYTYTYSHMHTNQNNQTTNTSEDDYYSVAASALPNETRPEELPEYAQLKK